VQYTLTVGWATPHGEHCVISSVHAIYITRKNIDLHIENDGMTEQLHKMIF